MNKKKKWSIRFRMYLLLAIAISSMALALRFFERADISSQALYNAGVDVLGIYVCVVLYYGCASDIDKGSDDSSFWLIALILLIGLSFFNNELSWYIANTPRYRLYYLFLNELTKIFDFGLVMLFYNYVRRTLSFEGKLAKWLDRYVFILIFPFILLVLANTFFPICFSVDAQGVFHEESLYRLVDLYMVIVAPLTVILINRCKASHRQKFVAFSFIAIPIIHYLLTGGAHGYATQYGSTLISVILIYGILFTDRSNKLASTRTELNTAGKIQDAMLPHTFPPFPERKEFDLYASMDAAKEVGGDFYDFFLLDDDHLGIVMADVSGKGVPGALFMMISKVILQNCAQYDNSPAKVLSNMNDTICSNNQEQMFVTVWFGILTISTGMIVAANAGHEYPIIMKHGHDFELIKDRHSFVIGALPDVEYQEYTIAMEAGDKLFLYTDGIPEAVNSSNVQYGIDRLIKALNQIKDSDPEMILKYIKTSVELFKGDAEQFDDLTMLCLEYKG
ncbi:MAG: PP2C family protein-serine/threonine phosphatase [Erysipelotrichaceae bacterium]|nr:PP2C family protein-serine/threonine phosphatase [Erysipelotrichaceae bacterium]